MLCFFACLLACCRHLPTYYVLALLTCSLAYLLTCLLATCLFLYHYVLHIITHTSTQVYASICIGALGTQTGCMDVPFNPVALALTGWRHPTDSFGRMARVVMWVGGHGHMTQTHGQMDSSTERNQRYQCACYETTTTYTDLNLVS